LTNTLAGGDIQNTDGNNTATVDQTIGLPVRNIIFPDFGVLFMLKMEVMNILCGNRMKI